MTNRKGGKRLGKRVEAGSKVVRGRLGRGGAKAARRGTAGAPKGEGRRSRGAPSRLPAPAVTPATVPAEGLVRGGLRDAAHAARVRAVVTGGLSAGASRDECRVPPDLAPLLRDISTLRADPENVRRHPERSLDALKASLQRFGQTRPVLALRSGVVIAGNGLLEAALALGWTRLAAVVFPTDDANEARAYALADNRTAELSFWDHEALAGLLQSLNTDGIDVTDLGWSPAELEMLLKSDFTPAAPQEGGLANEGTKHAVALTHEQFEVVMRAVARCRQDAGEEATDGRCVELICADYLAGAE